MENRKETENKEGKSSTCVGRGSKGGIKFKYLNLNLIMMGFYVFRNTSREGKRKKVGIDHATFT